MRCVTPMFRVFQKEHHETGRIIAREKVLEHLNYDPNYIRTQMERFKERDPSIGIEQIPCGKCWACKLNYSAQWATRLSLETKKSEHNYFITFTYDDNHLPINERVKIGEEVIENDGTWGGSLDPEDMTRFIKTLRKHFEREYKEQGLEPPKIKYFYCGEYGPSTQRPHYHMILLNAPLDLSQFYGTFVDTNFKAHWKSKQLEHWWAKGMIDVAEVEWSNAAYVARYCMKKLQQYGSKEDYYRDGRYPEFIRMSKGIGFEYFQQHKDEIYKHDEIVMKTIKGNIGSVKPPKAFDRKMKELDPEGFELIQLSRKHAAERADEIKRTLTSYTDKQMLEMEREKVLLKAGMLPREGSETVGTL